ncbi:hypothetical protein [Paenibacillus daejeonensis]|uniref:hypothetical protein n=1 Tax=Paenibacillus daejeonensis TaxID=135193 RepID=UPI000369D5C3|nr:hypothetical protein [Paenibacillus daejeonensis]
MSEPLSSVVQGEVKERPLKALPMVRGANLVSTFGGMLSASVIYFNPYLPVGWSIASTVMLMVLVAAFIYHAYHLIKGAPRIILSEEHLEVNGRVYYPHDLAMLLVRTGKAPAIGIVPVGRSLAPMAYAARLDKAGYDDMNRLVAWARQRGIKVRHKRIITW